MTQAEKGLAFRALHQREGAFIIPNPWDAGSAKILAHLGFEALATTSMGAAYSFGRLDGQLSREQTFSNAAVIVEATTLPISADLEDCFGDTAEAVAETIRLCSQTGIVGGSVEDSTGRPEDPIYEFEFAVERVRAAVEAARSLPFTFTLTARAENFITGRPYLDDTIKRLQAFQDAGADVLFAPGIKTREQIRAVLSSIDRPLNVLMGMVGVDLDLAELSEMGVKRISVGGSLCRAAIGGFLKAAREMKDHGTFNYNAEAVPYKELTAML